MVQAKGAARAKRRPWADDVAAVQRLFAAGQVDAGEATRAVALAQAFPEHREALITHLAGQPAGRYVNASVSVNLSYGSVLARLGEERKQREQRQVPRAAAASPAARVRRSGAVFAANPLLVEAQAAGLVRESSTPAPTLFPTGDLPPITASGMDPQVLLNLPWQARHPAAEAPTVQEAYRIVEDCGGGPDGEVIAAMEHAAHPGNRAYQERVNQWLLSEPPAE